MNRIAPSLPGSTRLLSLLCVTLVIVNCSHRELRPTAAEELLLRSALKELGPEFSKPRLVEAELLVRIDDIQIIRESADSLGRTPLGSGPAELHIWAAAPQSTRTQQLLSHHRGAVEPTPTLTFREAEYGNRIYYWNILKDHADTGSAQLSRRFSYLTFDYRPVPDAAQERQAWDSIPDDLLALYTRAEPFLEQDQELIDTVFTLLENSTDPIDQARLLYTWVRRSMTYVYPPPERGVRSALETLQGDCGQYSALFITMARIAGIPARQQSGFNFYPGAVGAHVWSEIYLPLKGWVPVDATREDGFLHLDNRRLIMSLGLNIALEQVPDWASFSNSEVESGRTDFMQMFTLAARGVKADYSSQQLILRSIELP